MHKDQSLTPDLILLFCSHPGFKVKLAIKCLSSEVELRFDA